MPDKSKPLYLNLSTLGQFQAPPNPGPGWVGPERPAESWADVRADPLSALFDLGRGAVTGDAPVGMNVQGLGALLAAAMPVAQGAKALRAATKAAKLSNLTEEAAQAGIKAYHGSPHDFDQFSLSKIGTGEGAQAYGHGLYFAEQEGVARSYRDMAKVTINGRPFNPSDPTHKAAAMVDELGSSASAITAAKAKLARDPGDTFYRDVIQRLESTRPLPKIESSGKMYEVQIHASPDQFLDWDKPLSQQSETVQKAARQFVKQGNGGYWDFTGDLFLGKDPTGKQIYDAAHYYREMQFQRQHVVPAGREGATDALKAQGIPGIRYLDAGSRSAGEGSRNYVIFDDSLVSILKKYGIALPVIEGLRERAKQNGGVISRQDVDSLQ